MDLRRKPVRQIADHGKPAAGIKQITDGIADRRNLESFDRALFAAAERTPIDKGEGGARSLAHGTRQSDADGCVGAPLSVERVVLTHR